MKFLTITNKIKNEIIDLDFRIFIFENKINYKKCISNSKSIIIIEIEDDQDIQKIKNYENYENYFLIEKVLKSKNDNLYDLFDMKNFLTKNHNREIIKLKRNDIIKEILNYNKNGR